MDKTRDNHSQLLTASISFRERDNCINSVILCAETKGSGLLPDKTKRNRDSSVDNDTGGSSHLHRLLPALLGLVAAARSRRGTA